MNEELEDQKSIDDLPTEMLEEVFLALDAKSLKNCCLVNKKWNNVIGQSSSVMEKLPLLLYKNYKKSWSDIYNATKNFERKFHTIDFNHFDVSDEYAIKTLNKFGAECRRIQSSCCYSSNEISMESLKFPLLQSAKITNVDEESQMLKILSSTQFKHLSYVGRSGFSEVMTFLSTQTKLTEISLSFEDCNISKRCLSDIKRIQIPLKTLSLTTYATLEDPEMMVAVLSRFAETLENFIFNFKCDLVYELIFTKFNKLKTLSVNSVNFRFAPQEGSFYHKLRPNYSVKKLVVGNFNLSNQEKFNRFIGLLPNVETLSLFYSEIPNDVLLCVSNHLKRLTTLELDRVHYDDVEKLARVCLPSVKTIVFGQVEGIGHEQWKLIVDAMPNVESMSIKYFDYPKLISCRSIEIIAKSWPNLTFLKFGKGFVAHDIIFIELLHNCKNIKTIEVEEDAFEYETFKAKILESVKKHGLRLIVHKSY